MPITTGGDTYPINLSPGGGVANALSRPGFTAISVPPGIHADASTLGGSSVSAAAPAFTPPSASPTWYLLGLVGLVVAMHVVEREREEIEGKVMGLNIWNFISTGLMASTFILTLKIGAYKWAPNSTFASVAGAI